MKVFTCVLLLAAVALAEPPRYRFARNRYDTRELEEPSQERKESANAEEAPYPVAGYRPSKEFKLPSRQEAAPPSTSYGFPDNSYGAPLRTYSRPEVGYGVPRMAKREETEGEEGESNEGGEEEERGEGERGENQEGEGEGRGEGKAEELRGGEGGEKKKNRGEKSGKLEFTPENNDEVVSTQGAYYVLLPGSQLQRVQFKTENDISKMAYTARLQYRDEDRAPLFVYSAAAPQYSVPVAEYAYDVPLASSSAYFQLY